MVAHQRLHPLSRLVSLGATSHRSKAAFRRHAAETGCLKRFDKRAAREALSAAPASWSREVSYLL